MRGLVRCASEACLSMNCQVAVVADFTRDQSNYSRAFVSCLPLSWWLSDTARVFCLPSTAAMQPCIRNTTNQVLLFYLCHDWQCVWQSDLDNYLILLLFVLLRTPNHSTLQSQAILESVSNMRQLHRLVKHIITLKVCGWGKFVISSWQSIDSENMSVIT